jgi:hypothetical protein
LISTNASRIPIKIPDKDHAARSVTSRAEDGAKIGELKHDGQGILLDFDGNPSLKALATEYAEMKYVSSRAKEQLGLSAVLIRPDGYVAWASDSEPDEQSIRQAAALWLAPVPPLQ